MRFCVLCHLRFGIADGVRGTGFAARPDTKDDVVKAQYELALGETIEWFKTHL